MTIAELFIKLGITGADKTKKEIAGVEGGLKGIQSSSLLAKAGLLGVIYGMERLTGFASQIGMDLYKFNVTTGLSAQELQKWQYAAMRFDVSGEEMASTIKNIQNAMSDMLLGKGAPGALGMLAEKVGFDPKRARDTFYVLEKIQQFAKTQPPDIANNLLKSFGISDNVFQMLKASNLEIDKISKKDILNDKQIHRLVEVNKAWKDFWFSLKMMGTRMVATNGMTAIHELQKAFKFMVGTGEDIYKLAKAFPVLQEAAVAAAVAIAAAFAPVTAAVTALLLAMSDLQKYREGKDSQLGDILNGKSQSRLDQTGGIGGTMDRLKNNKGDILKAAIGDTVNAVSGVGKMFTGSFPSIFTKKPEAVGPNQPSNVNINNTFHIDGSKDPQETATHVQRMIEDAFYKSPAQAGGQ